MASVFVGGRRTTVWAESASALQQLLKGCLDTGFHVNLQSRFALLISPPCKQGPFNTAPTVVSAQECTQLKLPRGLEPKQTFEAPRLDRQVLDDRSGCPHFGSVLLYQVNTVNVKLSSLQKRIPAEC